jgi:hypothetical protein
MNPSLSVDNVTEGPAGSAYRKTFGLQCLYERLYFRSITSQKLDVMAAGKTQITFTILICKCADIADKINTYQSGRSNSDSI